MKENVDIIRLNSINQPELDIYARYRENELYHIYEPELGLFIAESPKVIERALDAGYEPVSVLVEDKHIETQGKEIIKRCESVPVYTASFDVLTKITGFNLTRGMLCAMRRRPLKTAEEICKDAKRIAVLDDIENPTNVGAIFRSAAALNVDGIILNGACSDPLYRRSLRVSMGTVFQVPWTICDNDDVIETLKKNGFVTVAMALKEDSVSISDKRIKQAENLAIVLGNESEGLSDSAIRACDYTVMIPMSHGVDSLNVAAASAVAFWEMCNFY
ncbi:MAG: RNA methyltransferase [Lachnospiraceae bacterium]|nr:RNA methyltransferase [Lachnospiraceae bacterium]